MQYFAPRPTDVFSALQYTGDNYSEIEELATNMNFGCSLNPDGTVTLTGGMYGLYTIHENEWLTTQGNIINSIDLEEQYQTLDAKPNGHVFTYPE